MFKHLILLFPLLSLAHAQAETPSAVATSEYAPTETPADALIPRDDPPPPEFSAYVPTESRSFGSMVESATAVPVAEGEGVLKKKTVSADFAPVQENDGVGVRGLEVVMVLGMAVVVVLL